MRKLCFILVPLLFVACTEQQPAAPDIEVAPSFDFMNGPANPGQSPVVSRFADNGFLSITDLDRGLRVRLYDTFNTFRCNDPGVPDPIWGYQDAFTSNERLKSLVRSQEVPLVVYPFPNTVQGPGLEEFCRFLEEDWLYRGWGNAHNNDNNVFWFTGTGGNNAFGVRAQGTVWDRDGNKHGLTAQDHTVVNGLCCWFFDDPVTGEPVYIPEEDEDFREIKRTRWIKITP